jgi:hypothetical protein
MEPAAARAGPGPSAIERLQHEKPVQRTFHLTHGYRLGENWRQHRARNKYD